MKLFPGKCGKWHFGIPKNKNFLGACPLTPQAANFLFNAYSMKNAGYVPAMDMVSKERINKKHETK